MTRPQVIAGVAFALGLALVTGLRVQVGLQATLHLDPVKDFTPFLNGPKARFVVPQGPLNAGDWTIWRPVH